MRLLETVAPILLVLAGCSLPPPAASPAPDGGRPAAGAGVGRDTLAWGQEVGAAHPRDSLLPGRRPGNLPRDSAAVADSLADAEMLARLEDAHPPSDVGLAPEPATLDLTTWVGHPRVQYYLDFFQGPARSRMEVWLARLPMYEPMIRERLRAEGLPEDLLYLALIESGYSNVAVSRSRAVGMWQFMLGTARWMGLTVDRWVDQRRDPVVATDAAARYLAMLTQQFGSHYLAAAAYNGGPGRVSRGLERLGPAGQGEVTNADSGSQAIWSDEHFFTLADTRHLSAETKDYVPKLIAAALIARNPEAYGFPPVPKVQPYPRDSIVVPDMTGLDVIARLAGVPVAVIRELNPHYLRGVTPPGRRAVVRLPAGTMDAVIAAYRDLPPRERVTFREHVVARGETMSGIARRYGISLAMLREANPRVHPQRMPVGQVLVIPVAGAWSAPSSAVATGPVPAVHVVRAGETLSGIAARYGTTVAQLRARNGLSDSDLIRVGQRLRITGGGAGSPAASAAARVHVVRAGETLSGLARRYGVSVQALQQANNLSSPRDLRAGQRLRIPGAS